MGELEGVQVKFLVDTGANLTIVRPEIYNQLPEPERPELKPVNLEMAVADGRPLPFHGCASFRLKIGELAVRHDVWVANIDIDGILGYEFLQTYGCTLDAGKGKLTIGSQRQENNKVRPSCCRIPLKETIVVAADSEKMCTGLLTDGEPHGGPAVVEPSEGLVGRHGLLLAKIVVDTSKRVIPLRLMNPSGVPVTLYKGTTVGTCEPVIVIEASEENRVNCISVGEKATLEDPEEREGVLPEHIQDLAERSCHGLDADQRGKTMELLADFADVFAKTPDDLGRTNVAKHRIETGLAKPIRQAARRLPVHQKEQARKEIDRMLKADIIEPSSSSWSSPVVLVKKKDGSTRFCVDYRKLNEVTTKDSYPLPRIDDTLDTLSGSRWFCTLDLASGYWQVEVEENDRPKTAFVTFTGLYQFKVLPFGLCNAPATFERLMERILKGLQWHTCLLYLDDVIVYGETFLKTLDRLREVLQKLREAGLKLSPKKCNLFRNQVAYLGHIVSQEGISPDPEKTQVVTNWPIPASVTEVRGFVGLCSYYRKFIRGFSEICAPLHKLTEKGTKFKWSEDCDTAFLKLKRALTTAPILAYPVENDPFILDTDACDVGIGAVLSQCQEGQPERVIAYFSKSLSKAERRYCVTRKELLAVVASVKHFHHYLYGRKFLVRTDHGALRWLTNFRNPEGQVARWIETLMTYDYEIQHRPGRQHGNADSLSRRPCVECSHCERAEAKEKSEETTREPGNDSRLTLYTVTSKEGDNADDGSEASKDSNKQPAGVSTSWVPKWTIEELKEMQIQDNDIGPILLWKQVQNSRPAWEQVACKSPATKNYWTQWDRLVLRNGILYRSFESHAGDRKLWQLVVPKKLQEHILEQAHGHRLSGHLMVRKTLSRVRSHYYWSGYRKAVEKWCRQCDPCAARKHPNKRPNAKLKKYATGEPLQRCALDIMGPLPETEKGNRYVLVLADYFSKWTEAYPMPDMEAATVARIMVEEFICRFGVPLEIHTDQGRQFESQLFQQLCALLDVKKTRTTPFHPQSDGMVERFNRTLEDMLATVVRPDQKDWDVWLPYVMMAYRSAEHESTGFSPAEIFLGRPVSLPVHLEIPTAPDEDEPKTVQQYVEDLSSRLEKVHECARKQLKVASEKQRRAHDRKAFTESYEVGELIWLLDSTRKRGISPKLQKHWDGPGKVLKKISDILYRVKMGPRKRPKIVHHNRLKKYKGEDPPLWLLKPTSDPPVKTVQSIEEVEANESQ